MFERISSPHHLIIYASFALSLYSLAISRRNDSSLEESPVLAQPPQSGVHPHRLSKRSPDSENINSNNNCRCPPGARGPPGKRGRRGKPGSSGVPGPPGKNGFPGPFGIDGPKGEKGDSGTPGLKGEPGGQGLSLLDPNESSGLGIPFDPEKILMFKGEPGPTGPPGSPGPQGEAGLPGYDGVQGRPGESGPTGEPGLKGECLRGSGGGVGVVSVGTGGAFPTAIIEGPPGPPGPKGESGRDGINGEPGRSGTPGKNGIPGSPGKRGKRGRDGPPGKGEKGDPGEAAMRGDPGRSGEPGIPGTPGSKGDTGDSGTSGKDGERGKRGKKGERGDKGFPGPPGLDAPCPLGPDGLPMAGCGWGGAGSLLPGFDSSSLFESPGEPESHHYGPLDREDSSSAGSSSSSHQYGSPSYYAPSLSYDEWNDYEDVDEDISVGGNPDGRDDDDGGKEVSWNPWSTYDDSESVWGSQKVST